MTDARENIEQGQRIVTMLHPAYIAAVSAVHINAVKTQVIDRLRQNHICRGRSTIGSTLRATNTCELLVCMFNCCLLGVCQSSRWA